MVLVQQKQLFWKRWNHADPYIPAVEYVSARVRRKKREPTNLEAWTKKDPKIGHEQMIQQIRKTHEKAIQNGTNIQDKSIQKSITSGNWRLGARKWRAEAWKCKPEARKWMPELENGDQIPESCAQTAEMDQDPGWRSQYLGRAPEDSGDPLPKYMYRLAWTCQLNWQIGMWNRSLCGQGRLSDWFVESIDTSLRTFSWLVTWSSNMIE